MAGADALLEPLLALHARVRAAVVDACAARAMDDLANVTASGPGGGDTIYAIDRVAEETFLSGLGTLGEPVCVVAEGLEGAQERDCRWRLLVDPIDGTRGLMYQKRSAWILTGVAPNRGADTRLSDIVLAVQTEIPLLKQHLSDELWAARGRGVEARRFNRLTNARERLTLRPSSAESIAHGFASVTRFFPGAREVLAAIDDEIAAALVPNVPGRAATFEDQYLSTGGQLYELMAGHDRFIADLRAVVQPQGLCCHPYDLAASLIAEEAGVVLTDAHGERLDAPFDVHSNVSWVGYANPRIRQSVEPVLHKALARRVSVVARAPGRLDVMGGIADYSGARVLELPLACATTVAIQVLKETRCEVATLRGDEWMHMAVELPFLIEPDGKLGTPARLRASLERREERRWWGYVLGVVQACLQRAAQTGAEVPAGLRLVITSTVPEGAGVASSAALEVATGLAVNKALGVSMPPEELAALCQAVENHVVGAPCGIMDQMTSACGGQGSLLRLRCQPGTIEGFLEIPAGYRFYGIDSGIRHAVSGTPYGTVRTAAFMGYRILAAASGDARWHGYLANVTPDEFAKFGGALPEEMKGAEFLERYGGTTDTATTVRPDVLYPVRRATEHPIMEEQRVVRFAALLGEVAHRPAAATEAGRLMYESHASYGACGLGSDGTDRLVELARAAGPERGIFGARITGGGSGGTVAIFGTSAAEPLVRELAGRYEKETGRPARVFA